jgi:hypothetical protein
MLAVIALATLFHKLQQRRSALAAAQLADTPASAALDVIEGELLAAEAENDHAGDSGSDTPALPLNRRHTFGLVGFHERGFIIARPTSPYAPWLHERITTLHQRLGGMSNMTDGLRQAFDLLATMPPGIRRTVWLLCGGTPNRELRSLFAVVGLCRQARIGIHTVGLGRDYDAALLGEIAGFSHRGSHHSAADERSLAPILTTPASADGEPHGEATIAVVDCSYAMSGRIRRHSKIGVVEDALLDLIHQQKRRCG